MMYHDDGEDGDVLQHTGIIIVKISFSMIFYTICS